MAIILAFLRTTKSIQQTTLKDLIRRLDLPRLCLILEGLICFILVTKTAGAKQALDFSVVIGELIGFILLAIAFGIVEWYSQEQAAVVPRILPQKLSASLVRYKEFFPSPISPKSLLNPLRRPHNLIRHIDMSNEPFPIRSIAILIVFQPRDLSN